MEFEFPIIKLVDYQQETLLNTLNPFAIVLIGYLSSRSTIIYTLKDRTAMN
jgi:hypothetical protein